ncbi:MAG: urea ABC transporter permease subunit UrtC [Phycisphaerae bacterium]|nr:urea ABC transporter permease subunit UrtC [Phycisphaerae bacterium]
MSETQEEIVPAEVRSREKYRASQTFLIKSSPPRVIILRIVSVALVALLFFVTIPALTLAGVIPDYKLNFLGKYLCFALVALGIDLIWGYTGLLSLCQALFFCLGGYAMAMHLSVKQGWGDVRPEYNDIPQFMFFNNVRALPWFWKPFVSFPFAIAAGLILPGLVACVFGFFILRSRVRGVYFSIITQAVAWGSVLLIQRNEMLLGGTNGLTNFYKGFNEKRGWIVGLYLLTASMVVAGYLVCWLITRSRLGRVLVAIRDRETRLYFAGYKPYAFKVFAFTVGAMLAGLGGMLYSPQVGIITPQNMSVETSILMVIWVALGGRGKLWGAIFGALLTNVTLSSLSSDLPGLWLFVQGGMFLLVVLLFPDGFVGLWSAAERQLASGVSWLRALWTILPLVLVGLFVMAESLTLMPRFLRASAFRSEKIGDLEWKYVVLIVLLAIVGGVQVLLKRRDEAGRLK